MPEAFFSVSCQAKNEHSPALWLSADDCISFPTATTSPQQHFSGSFYSTGFAAALLCTTLAFWFNFCALFADALALESASFSVSFAFFSASLTFPKLFFALFKALPWSLFSFLAAAACFSLICSFFNSFLATWAAAVAFCSAAFFLSTALDNFFSAFAATFFAFIFCFSACFSFSTAAFSFSMHGPIFALAASNALWAHFCLGCLQR